MNTPEARVASWKEQWAVFVRIQQCPDLRFRRFNFPMVRYAFTSSDGFLETSHMLRGGGVVPILEKVERWWEFLYLKSLSFSGFQSFLVSCLLVSWFLDFKASKTRTKCLNVSKRYWFHVIKFPFRFLEDIDPISMISDFCWRVFGICRRPIDTEL